MDPNICALIPAYNHATALVGVVRAAKRVVPVIVVNDGSTDGSERALAGEPGIEVVTHPVNRGKAEALRSGFRRALELGYSHAISLDADGQHLPSDIPRFVEACRARPEAMLVGVRDFNGPGVPATRRRANRFSNLWFRISSGVYLGDTQCGFRCYPLEDTLRINARAERYGYELEIMVRAAWLDIPLIPVPVGVVYSEATARGSHFRPVVDFLRLTRLNARLLALAFFVPRPLRAIMSKGMLKGLSFREKLGTIGRELFCEHMESSGRFAAAIALGVFFALAPIWGLQTLSALAAAHALRLNKAVTAAVCNLSIPPTIPFILYCNLVIGNALFGGAPLDLRISEMTRELAAAYFVQWLAGSLVMAFSCAALAFAIGYSAASVRGRCRRAGP